MKIHSILVYITADSGKCRYDCRCNCYRNTLYSGRFRQDGSGPAVIAGLAWIGSACKGRQRTSVNQEFGQYASITTGAHELGHKYASTVTQLYVVK